MMSIISLLRQTASHMMVWPVAAGLAFLWLLRHAGNSWQAWGWQGGWFAIGLILGLLFSTFDRLLLYPRYRSSGAVEPFITDSMLFLGPFVGVAVFVLTSTGSTLGSALVLGIALNATATIWQLKGQPEVLQQRFLPRLRRELSAKQAFYLGWCAVAVMVALALLSLLF